MFHACSRLFGLRTVSGTMGHNSTLRWWWWRPEIGRCCCAHAAETCRQSHLVTGRCGGLQSVCPRDFKHQAHGRVAFQTRGQAPLAQHLCSALDVFFFRSVGALASQTAASSLLRTSGSLTLSGGNAPARSSHAWPAQVFLEHSTSLTKKETNSVQVPSMDAAAEFACPSTVLIPRRI